MASHEENGAEAEHVEQAPRVVLSKRCFVGNLAWRTSWQDLKDKFRECGSVVYANVMHYEDGRSKGWGIVEFETPDEAAVAIDTLNGVDMSGRRLLVREDREDRDLKGQGHHGGNAAGGQDENGASSAPAPRAPRPGRGSGAPGGRGAAPAGGRGAGGRGAGGRGGRGSAPPERSGESSGLQVVVRGIPWAYTWRELKDLFAEIGDIERADVVYGDDGRSRGYGTVRFYTAESAQSAIAKYHETDLDGRSLSVFLDKFA